MLTLYSIVKGFEGHTGIIQRNAIRSWLKVLPGAEIILFGADEPGAVEVADAFGLPILPLPRNEHGAPLFPAVIEAAHAAAHHDVRLLVNADIILPPNVMGVVAAISDAFDEFLLITHRIKVHVDQEIDFGGNWFAWLRGLKSKFGISSAIDLFCYRGGWLRDVPPFGVGRTSWDNWMIVKATTEGVPVIDASTTFDAWHQEHPINKPKNQIKQNRALLRKASGLGSGTLNAAMWRITPTGLVERKRQ